MIEFHNVHASYNASVPVLKGVDFTIEDGAFVAFVGTNGAGKSTTMRLIDGLIKPDEGEVLIDGVPTTELRTSELAKRVGFLFQNPDSQICNNTVRDELMFGFKALHEEGPEAEERVAGIIELFGFDPDADPFLLNRGTRQLLALASIVVMAPQVLVLDEPTTGLDFRECEKVMDIVRTLHERGTTVVMVCHDMEIVGDFAEQVIVMNDGRVVDQGPTFEVLRRRETLERASLMPPQMVDLSLTLAAADARLAQAPVGQANTLDEMEAAVRAEAGKGAAAAPGVPVVEPAGAAPAADVVTGAKAMPAADAVAPAATAAPVASAAAPTAASRSHARVIPFPTARDDAAQQAAEQGGR